MGLSFILEAEVGIGIELSLGYTACKNFSTALTVSAPISDCFTTFAVAVGGLVEAKGKAFEVAVEYTWWCIFNPNNPPHLITTVCGPRHGLGEYDKYIMVETQVAPPPIICGGPIWTHPLLHGIRMIPGCSPLCGSAAYPIPCCGCYGLP